MSSTKDEKHTINRREFFYGVAGTTMVAALSQLGPQALNAAQVGGAGSALLQTGSFFFGNPPGASGNIHSSLLRYSLNAFSDKDAISQYAAPMSFELSGKNFVIMRGSKHKDNTAPGVMFSAYPERTVTLDGVKLPYQAAKITNELVFAAFQVGTDAYACVFDPSKSVASNNIPKSAGASTPGIISTALCVDTAENPARAGFAFNTSQDFPDTDTDFTGNVLEWTFAPESSARFDYNARNVSFNAPGGAAATSANIMRLETRGLSEGIYFQGIQIEMSGNPPVWLVLAMNFSQVFTVGAAFGSTRGAPFMFPIGGHGRLLNAGEIKM